MPVEFFGDALQLLDYRAEDGIVFHAGRQRISAVMRCAIARGYGEDNPADERVAAALGRNTKPPVHYNALHHTGVKNAMETINTIDAYWAPRRRCGS